MPKNMSKSEYYRILAMRTVGNFLVIFSIYMISWVFYKPALEEIKYAYNQAIGKKYVLVDEAPSYKQPENSAPKGLLAAALKLNSIEVLVPKDPNFSIIIPKLGANANIIPNVDSSNPDQYLPALEAGVAHAAGTKFPGEHGHVYLFAHSTNTFSNIARFNAIFYLLYKLEAGDEINLYYQGIRHKYIVTSKTIVDPSEVNYITKKTDTEFLTLQTCWPPGTIAQRMLVFAEPTIK
ncbi:MAG TPA: sortase [Acidimicrobiia bacterium]|nr:sortase [Acidimicrobiia bacterium]